MTRLLALLALAAPLALAGCDVLSGPDGSASPVANASPKLRHWDLLTHGLDGQAAALGDSIDFIVTFSDLVGDPEAAADQLFMAQEVVRRTYYRDSFTGVAVTTSADQLNGVLNALIASDSVAFVEPDIPLDPVVNQPEYLDLATISRTGATYNPSNWHGDQLRPWSVKRIDAHDSWARSGDGQGTVDVDVYVIDGPIAHPDLNVVERVSFLPAGVTPADPLHGTHVAGIIGARDDNAGLVGVAPGARIHSLVVLDAHGATTMSTLLSAVEFVTARRLAAPSQPIVVNMSVGMDVGTTALNALDEAVARAVTAGVVFVASAGNGAANAATYSPAHAPGVIAVGASDNYDHFARTFSNYGATIALHAPGVDILSTADDGRYAILSGTSMAAPHVAGTAALYLAQHPSASPSAVLNRLRDRSKNIQNNGLPSGTTRDRVRAQGL